MQVVSHKHYTSTQSKINDWKQKNLKINRAETCRTCAEMIDLILFLSEKRLLLPNWPNIQDSVGSGVIKSRTY